MSVRVFLSLILSLAAVACKPTVTTRSGLDPRRFETSTDGKHTALYVLKNRNGMEVCLCNFGARVVSIVVPDRNGVPTDVTLGFDNLVDYRNVNCNFGATIGRYANRIAGARFELDGQTFLLSANSGPHCLHGGIRGWQARVFDVGQASDSVVRFTYLSPDGEEGFPGSVRILVEYRLTADNALRILYTATSDRPTVVNPTNHTFFNLSGDPSQTALGHRLQVDADGFIPVDSLLIPLGEIAPVTGTPMDFRTPSLLSEKMDTLSQQIALAHGYDHTWVLNDRRCPDLPAAALYSPESGIRMEVFTDAPGIQVFTANAFNGAFEGRRAIAYRNRPAVCLETQYFPDSPNHPDWPSTVLRPGEVRRGSCVYRFSVE